MAKKVSKYAKKSAKKGGKMMMKEKEMYRMHKPKH